MEKNYGDRGSTLSVKKGKQKKGPHAKRSDLNLTQGYMWLSIRTVSYWTGRGQRHVYQAPTRAWWKKKIENKHDKRNNVVWERPAICVNIYTYIVFASHL